MIRVYAEGKKEEVAVEEERVSCVRSVFVSYEIIPRMLNAQAELYIDINKAFPKSLNSCNALFSSRQSPIDIYMNAFGMSQNVQHV